MSNDIIAALQAHQADVVKRMVDNTWLVHYPPESLRTLEESIPAIAHAFVYVDHFVVHDELKGNLASGQSAIGCFFKLKTDIMWTLQASFERSLSYSMKMLVLTLNVFSQRSRAKAIHSL